MRHITVDFHYVIGQNTHVVDDAFLSPRDLARVIGASESSLKRWIDDGRLAVHRTVGGHRRIPVSEAVRFIRAHRHPVIDPRPLGLHAAAVQVADGGLEQRLAEALLASDAATAESLVTGAFAAGMGLAAIGDGPVRGALRTVGERWKHGPHGIAQEHIASLIIQRTLHRLQGMLPEPARTAPLAVGGAGDDDPYELPSLLVSLVLQEAGWRTLDIGARTPRASVVAAASEHRARLVWRSWTWSAAPEAALDDLRRLTAAVAPLTVIAGGQLLAPLRLPNAENLVPMASLGEVAAFARGAR